MDLFRTTDKVVPTLRYDRCILCQRNTKDKLIIAKSIDTFRYLLKPEEDSQVTASAKNNYVYHKKCYSLRKKEQDKDNEGEGPCWSPKKTRTTIKLSFENAFCVFCQSKKKVHEKGPLILFATDKAQARIETCLQKCTDQALKDRLRDVDLVANDVKYHKSCYSNFISNTQYTPKPRETNISNCIHSTFNHFKKDFDTGKAISVNALTEHYNQLSTEPREGRSILRSFMSKYDDAVQLVELSGKEKVLVGKQFTLLDLINKVKHQTTETTSEVDCPIKNAAATIARDIKAKWKPFDGFNITLETITNLIPNSLLVFLDEIGTRVGNTQQHAIAMDIVALCLRRIPPIHLSLALSIKYLTGSREVIDQLNKMGHCCSYTELLRFETSGALAEIEYAQTNGVIIPPIIQPARDGLLQAAADNDDFLEETIDGKNTTHATTMVVIQHLGKFSSNFNRPMIKTRRRSLDESEVKDLLAIRAIDHSKKTSFPGFQGTKAMRALLNTDFLITSEMNKARTLDTEWILCRVAPSKFFELNLEPSSQECPSWSSWNARQVTFNPNLKAVIGYCPMINAKSDDPSTVYTVLLQLKHMMEKLNQKHSIITFDLAIYKVAKEVVWNRQTEFEFTIVRLGGFHIITNFLGALGNMLQTSGVIGLFTGSEVFSEVTVKQILAGKHYNRGVRAHKLLYEALMRKKIFALKEWMSTQDDPTIDLDMSDRCTAEEMSNVAKLITNRLSDLDAAAKEDAHLYRFWNAYIESVHILLGLLRAERCGLWNLYLDSLISMLPIFYAYDRVNYSRWLPVYISDMLNLEDTAPMVYQEFLSGKFSINRTGKPFAAIPTDQVLEQTLNKDSKVSGGIRGISTDEEARTKWFLTSHVRVHMYSLQKEFLEQKKASTSRHREDVSSITMKDEADVQALLSTIDRSGVDIFSLEKNALVDISTGISPTEESAKNIIEAQQKGRERVKKFVEERLNEKKVAFDATLSKQKVPPFNTVSKSIGPEKTIIKKNKVPFDKLLIISQSRSLDIKELLKYETGSIPLALFDDKAKLRKAVKSQLVKTLEEKYLNDDFAIEGCAVGRALIIDGMVMVQMMKGAGTFQEYSEKIFNQVLSQGEGYNRVDVVFDVYHPGSIKSAERTRRGEQKMFNVKILDPETKIPGKWNDFLSNIHNKNELVNFFMRSWKDFASSVPDGMNVIVSSDEVISVTYPEESYQHLVSNHDEADTRLILHASNAIETHDTVIVRSVDTDVLVLAVHHFESIMSTQPQNKDIVLWLGTGEHKRYISIRQLITSMPVKVTKNLLPSYALTGCDSTSAIFRISKRKSVVVLEDGDFDLTELGDKTNLLSAECSAECERYMASLYGEFENLTEARYNMIATKNITNDSQLPPSINAAKYHFQRCAFQVCLWKQSLSAQVEDLPPTKDFGWDQSLRPVMCDMSPIQKEVAVSCKCKKSNCRNNICRCFKQGMNCTDSCLCQSCENMDLLLEDEESEGED